MAVVGLVAATALISISAWKRCRFVFSLMVSFKTWSCSRINQLRRVNVWCVSDGSVLSTVSRTVTCSAATLAAGLGPFLAPGLAPFFACGGGAGAEDVDGGGVRSFRN